MRRAERALTERTVAALKPRETRYHVADGGCPGLQIRVFPSGLKSWRWGYHAGGAKRWLTLGNFPALTLAEARRTAEAERLKVGAGGYDPARERDSRRKADAEAWSVRTLFGSGPDDLGWYLTTYVQTAGRAKAGKSAHSVATDTGYLRKHVWQRRTFLRRRIVDVTPADLETIRRECSEGAWSKLRAIFRIGFAHAEAVGQIPRASNPAVATGRTPDRKVERYLTAEERQRLEAVLTEALKIGPARRAHPGGVEPYVAHVIRLLSLTGARLSEITSLRWEFVDITPGREHLRLPTSKTGARKIPISGQAAAYLAKLRGPEPRIGPVFAGRLGGIAHPSTIKRAWRSIRARAELPDVRLHDLRHAFASDAISAGVPLATVAAILGHSIVATTERYAHLADAELRAGLAMVGERIDAATRGGN